MEKISSEIELQIGITDYCNFNCIMCMQSAHEGLYGNADIKTSVLHENKKGFMDFNLFKKIIDDISQLDFKMKTVAFHWLGESMMHPKFSEFIEYACQKNSEQKFTEYFILFTNCYFLTEKITDFLLKAIGKNPFIIVFSLDSISENTFKKIHRNKHFFRVYDNVKKFTEKSSEIDSIYRIYRFLVMEENFFEAGDFFQYWAKFLKNDFQITFNEEKNFNFSFSKNIINFKRVASFDVKKAEKLFTETIDSIFNHKKEKINVFDSFNFFENISLRPPCSAPFRTPVINWDGTLTVCCPDDKMELALGNVSDFNFEQLWFGKKAGEIRNSHIEGKLENYDRCRRCPNYAGRPLEQKEMEFYSKIC
jgi:radical SAM protein with 4Fe4S-binding SPASM domain